MSTLPSCIYDTAEGAESNWYRIVAADSSGEVRQVVEKYKQVPIEDFQL